MRTKRRTFLAGATAWAALPARAGSATLTRVGGPAFGSAWRVTAGGGVEGTAIARAVERVVASTDAAMSPWRHDSELSRFNRALPGETPVSAPLCAVAAAALDVADLSGGAFDPTVGPLVHRFGWGPIEGRDVGREALRMGPDRISKSAAVTLDLCAIAKGHALDRAVEALASLGLTDAMVEMGGEVRAMGSHPSGRAWQVAVEAPGSGPLAVQRVVAPGPIALATSGLSPNGYDSGTRRTCHIIDPRSARPVPGRLAQVTVASDSAAMADAWATALLVLGPEAGPDLAERSGLAALFLARDGARLREVMTGGFDDMVVA